MLFLCGVKYLVTYREANGRHLSHYLDDGLREAVALTLPVLMRCAECHPKALIGRRRSEEEVHPEFRRLISAFAGLNKQIPPATGQWLRNDEANIVRLTFGMGVASRFAPESHEFVRRFLDRPLVLPAPILDVVESFRWDPAWSVALAA